MLDHNINFDGRTILVTGAAGFIGSSLVARLLTEGEGMTIVGIDNMNDYYDVNLKRARLKRINTIALSEACLNKWSFVESILQIRLL